MLQEQKDAEDALRGKCLEFERDLGKVESRLKAQSHDPYPLELRNSLKPTEMIRK